ncbi:hypothetical protein [Pelosinus propionicus]|uniref:Uncharacterized protein n=1 Tax=Pelosinus propionicus DSM 13327 TaxID=1123291 RepID=A0A1I4PTK2_9FIRM|nr:hypothetical protein [Pelosinus propionicus]SFM31097.1 hypothetical protein SAMN04490355_107227 [Pelosinus propionicus DSM 13327]
MPFIKSVLLEEYNRFITRKADYEEKLLCGNITDERYQKIVKSLTNITEDMVFIEKSFRGNGLDIQIELVLFIEQSRK